MTNITNTSQEIFSALAEPTRRSIIELLAGSGQMTATQIYENFSSTPPAISQHLKVLRDADLVKVEKQAQKHIYTINTQTLHELGDWVGKINNLWQKRFERMENIWKKEL